MNRFIKLIITAICAVTLASCSGSPYRYVNASEKIESRYAIFQVPDTSWEVSKQRTTTSWSSGISSQRPGVTYNLNVSGYQLPDDSKLPYFDKNRAYTLTLRDEDMEIGKVQKEQGIGYIRNWVSYVSGIKCAEGVFSRNGGGMMASINNKNYGISCGYYHKQEGKRLLMISYRYHYAGGEVRHQKDKNIHHNDLLTLEQAEMQLKQAVKSVITTLQIKDVDWDRMRREGLLHPNTSYGISPY